MVNYKRANLASLDSYKQQSSSKFDNETRLQRIYSYCSIENMFFQVSFSEFNIFILSLLKKEWKNRRRSEWRHQWEHQIPRQPFLIVGSKGKHTYSYSKRRQFFISLRVLASFSRHFMRMRIRWETIFAWDMVQAIYVLPVSGGLGNRQFSLLKNRKLTLGVNKINKLN